MKSESAKVFQIAAIGEVLWDVFPSGPRFGGAPANFACSVAGLAGERAVVSMVSAVGNDELGTRALAEFAQRNVVTKYVPQTEFPTGQVLIELDATGSASYEFAGNCAWDNVLWSDELAELAAVCDVVCFGSLGQRSETSQQTIQKFVSATSDICLRIFDVNVRRPFIDDATVRTSLDLANVLKLNDDELPYVAGLFDVSGSEKEMLQTLARRLDLRVVALTRGSRGAVIVRGDDVHEFPGVSTNVVDTVGAGDAFTATLALGLLADDPLDQINRRACEVAAWVCSQSGATPIVSNLSGDQTLGGFDIK